MLRIKQVRYADPDAQILVGEVQAEYAVLYGGPDDTPLEPTAFDALSGAFCVGYLGDVPVAMGGWRFRPDVQALGQVRAAEVKRMYVAPAGRPNGFARAVLLHLEDAARGRGADLMVLETGLMQPQAIELYTSSGYEPVPAFGHYAWSPSARYYGRRL